MLEVKDIYCGYNKKLVLHGITFSAKKGDFIGIIGPNGSGKTTILRAISRVLKCESGEILFKNRAISKYKFKEQARYIAVLPQITSINFAFKVEEFVMMGRYPYINRFSGIRKSDIEAVEKAMVITDILELKEKSITQLSGGELQRVFLAQAIAQQPELLLLDEPTTHLDIGHQIAILNLILKLNRTEGLTVIAVLHDLNLASEYCNRLILIDRGRIYREGTASEVLTYPIIEEVYKTVVIIKENPITKKPYIFIVPEQALRTNYK